MKRILWLTAPFLVLALLVMSLGAMAVWLLGQPAAATTVAAPLASSASALEALSAIAADREDAANGNGRVYYLRGRNVDTANPIWDEELVDEVGSVRLDFLYIILDGNGIPTISYTTPDKEVTTASRNSAPLSISPCGNITPLTAVSRKVHGSAGTFDVNLLGLSMGIEPRTGGPSGNHEIVITFPARSGSSEPVLDSRGTSWIAMPTPCPRPWPK